MSNKWQKVPKIELHRHLEGSIRFSTLHELAEDLQGLSEEDARKKALVNSPSCGLAAIMEDFWRSQRIMNSPEIIERITFEACEDAANDGIAILELRYQPSFIQIDHPHLSFDVIHKSVVAGVKRAEAAYPSLCVGLIGIIGRNLSIEIAKETTEFILKNKSDFIGADLANVEIGNDCKNFAQFFQQMKAAGLGITVHQGEEGDPQTIKDAIDDLGADRIGHGIQAYKSEEIMNYLMERNVPLEVSVTSNYIVGVVDSIVDHPITKLKEYGVPVTINTDDPALFGDYTMTSEYDLLEKEHQWTSDDFKHANSVAYQASFIPEERKKQFWSKEKFDEALAN